MAYIVNNKADMAHMLKETIEGYQYDKSAQMLILPVRAVATRQDVDEVLKTFGPYIGIRTPDMEPNQSGTMSLATDNSALGIINSLDGASTCYPAQLNLAVDCVVKAKVKGHLTILVNLPMYGQQLVDVTAYAEKAKIPVGCNTTQDHPVFVYATADHLQSGLRYTIVILPTERPKHVEPMPEFSLKGHVELLQERAHSPFENAETLNFDGLKNGWQLKDNPRFLELISWLRPGYSYTVKTSETGLTMII